MQEVGSGGRGNEFLLVEEVQGVLWAEKEGFFLEEAEDFFQGVLLGVSGGGLSLAKEFIRKG